jgi:hypothetical protein
MNHKIQKSLSVLGIVLLVGMQVTTAYATETKTASDEAKTTKVTQKLAQAEDRKAQMEKRRTELQNRIAKKTEKEKARCEKINNNVEKIIENYDHKVGQNIESYKTVVLNIQKAVDNLSSKGINVDKLRADLVVVNQMIVQMSEHRAQYIETLEGSQNHVCGESEGDFKTKIQEARTQLSLIREDGDAIKAYIKNTIRPDLLEVREGLKNHNN